MLGWRCADRTSLAGRAPGPHVQAIHDNPCATSAPGSRCRSAHAALPPRAAFARDKASN